MNAGAMGGWIFDVVESIEWLAPHGQVRAARRDCFDALYRDCPQLHGAVVLSAVLRASGKDDGTLIRQRMDTMSVKRRASQPREASAGAGSRRAHSAKSETPRKLTHYSTAHAATKQRDLLLDNVEGGRRTMILRNTKHQNTARDARQKACGASETTSGAAVLERSHVLYPALGLKRL